MNTRILLTLAMLFSGSALAGFHGPHSAAIDNVAAAKQASEDSYFEMTGYIVQSLGNENYLFQDATGQIEVEIDNENWRGQQVSSQDKVVIRGEVEIELFEHEVEVDVIEKL